jgi:hypothetical protein
MAAGLPTTSELCGLRGDLRRTQSSGRHDPVMRKAPFLMRQDSTIKVISLTDNSAPSAPARMSMKCMPPTTMPSPINGGPTLRDVGGMRCASPLAPALVNRRALGSLLICSGHVRWRAQVNGGDGVSCPLDATKHEVRLTTAATVRASKKLVEAAGVVPAKSRRRRDLRA